MLSVRLAPAPHQERFGRLSARELLYLAVAVQKTSHQRKRQLACRGGDATQAFVDQVRHFSDSTQFGLCLIDTAPALGLRLVAAVSAANYVVSPIELEVYSTDGVTSMRKTIYGIRQKLNPGPQFLGMLPYDPAPCHRTGLR